MKNYYPVNGRVILHVDMNSFFASVEMAFDPSLKGKPLAIAGDEELRKGIVVTASYEARKFGVKATMPVWEARKLCPNLIVRKPNFERYRKVSRQMFEILRQYSSLVEPVSIDEGYIDITDCHSYGTPIQIAESIQQSLLNQLDLPCSIGIAPNKFLAKMASDMKKPLGITVLRIRDIPQVIWPMSTIEMHGIGAKTKEKLSSIQIHTIKDLAQANDIELRAALGVRGMILKERANGRDQRRVDPEAAEENKSIGHSITLPKDIANQAELLQVLRELSSSVANRLKNKGYMSKNISLMIRYKNRQTVTRSKTLVNPVNQAKDIFHVAEALFLSNWGGHQVRLLGITGQELLKENEAFEQLDLFSYEKAAKKEPLFRVVEEMTKKYGKSIIHLGKRKNN